MDIEKSMEILKEFKKTGFHTLMIKYNENRIHTNKLIEEAIETLLTAYEKEKETSHYIQSQLDIANAKLVEEKEKNKEYENMIINHKKQLKQSGIYGYDYDLKILKEE